ncbi:uncharacterized protein TRUGW13939_02286 [Talaromyces rugulosus]|uniref:Uncharacterized protein n=1 Tax=Talaromyces rugulosus TaxID=121627 RepID=A0A7H8QMR8_TALRU|nr:uncharacterized protein TRUGW13939_02286 [Talaromyces rugulosus]QKX55194.1 hypothetical protein TRUGW13939_02286 [Talaromyces rugulosus]
MANFVADRVHPSISPPPPVYIRASPPPPHPNSDLPQVPNMDLSEGPSSPTTVKRKSAALSPLQVDNEAHIHRSPLSPVRIDDSVAIPQASSAVIENSDDVGNESSFLDQSFSGMKISEEPKFPVRVDSMAPNMAANRHASASTGSWSLVGNDKDDSSKRGSTDRQDSVSKAYHNSNSSQGSLDSSQQMDYHPLQYHHRPFRDSPTGQRSGSSSAEYLANPNQLLAPGKQPRPVSAYSSTSDLRSRSPNFLANVQARRSSNYSPDTRPMSTFVDLINTSYPQPAPSPAAKNNENLRMLLGNNVSLLSHKQTFEMYLGNVKKTNDPAVQYEFAVFMISAVQEMYSNQDEDPKPVSGGKDKGVAPDITRSRLLIEAKAILQRLADRSYPFAQYYLGDGYSSGLFNKGKIDHERALPLFVAASKHGHAEAAYRAGLCNEFGWGCRVDGPKAMNFYRNAGVKNHPGALLRLGRACLSGDLGLGKRYREGLKWLKRAAEAADFQYNSAPFELGLLHENGFGDDVFKDEPYAAQLFTKSADLGHSDANYRMGHAYEIGELNCPVDPALSIHFYTAAAQMGHPEAQLALCAWYMIGADPILEKDEMEAYEWARQAAIQGLPKAEYTFGFFTETGIGCHPDALEANVWYVKAADQGEPRAQTRLKAIRNAAAGADPMTAAKSRKKKDRSPSNTRGEKSKSKFLGMF